MPKWSTVIRGPLGCILLNSSHAAEAVVRPTSCRNCSSAASKKRFIWEQYAVQNTYHSCPGRQAGSLHCSHLDKKVDSLLNVVVKHAIIILQGSISECEARSDLLCKGARLPAEVSSLSAAHAPI